jgi:hypothetical protein
VKLRKLSTYFLQTLISWEKIEEVETLFQYKYSGRNLIRPMTTMLWAIVQEYHTQMGASIGNQGMQNKHLIDKLHTFSPTLFHYYLLPIQS